MRCAASILIPTHDHGPLVGLAIESALAQTVEDLEVLLVGDGVPEITREVVGELAVRDPTCSVSSICRRVRAGGS
jgi:GalNAc5-diNAcBac-PP-undecaprenol beta-1,3-glucosyltransferase